jgi:glycosyltransferase involved in cell wall biosynthesis
MIMRLRRYLVSRNFDALFAFGFYPNFVAWAAVRGLRHRPALILSEINSPRREDLDSRGSWRGSAVKALRHVMYPRADIYAANSLDGISDAVQFYGVDPRRAQRLPNLIDPTWLARQATKKHPEPRSGVVSICIVTRLDRRKRVETLLRAAARLPADLNWRIDVVGDGDQRLALAALAQELDIVPRVVFHGWQENPHPIVAQAAASVLCSEYEGFSNSVLESMILGTPVVTSLCSSDSNEMVEKGAALGFPVGNHLALRAELVKLLTQESMRRRLQDRARRYAQAHTLPAAIRVYEQVVNDAVEQKRRAGGTLSARTERARARI